MSSREVFEQQYVTLFRQKPHSRLDRRMIDGSYRDITTQTAWLIWQARDAEVEALKARIVELNIRELDEMSERMQ